MGEGVLPTTNVEENSRNATSYILHFKKIIKTVIKNLSYRVLFTVIVKYRREMWPT